MTFPLLPRAYLLPVCRFFYYTGYSFIMPVYRWYIAGISPVKGFYKTIARPPPRGSPAGTVPELGRAPPGRRSPDPSNSTTRAGPIYQIERLTREASVTGITSFRYDRPSSPSPPILGPRTPSLGPTLNAPPPEGSPSPLFSFLFSISRAADPPLSGGGDPTGCGRSCRAPTGRDWGPGPSRFPRFPLSSSPHPPHPR